MDKFVEILIQPKWFADDIPSSPQKASATLTISGNVSEEETVTIGSEVYEFVESASQEPTTNIEVVLGDTEVAKDVAAKKLEAAINEISQIVTAEKIEVDDDVAVVVSYKKVGTEGNEIDIDTDCTNAFWDDSAENLSGGKYGTPCPITGLGIRVQDDSTPPNDIYYICTKAGGAETVEWKKVQLLDVNDED